MGDDQQIDLEGTTNGNSRPANISKMDTSTTNKSFWNCCPVCAKQQTDAIHQGIVQ